MLTKKQIKEIREHLSNAQNPVFFFDNDQDGLCSFLLLQRYIERGKGVAIKSFPELTKDYFRRVNELNADYIFILDKPLVSEEFFLKARQVNIPIVWIDHHRMDFSIVPDYVFYYNPLLKNEESYEPVSLICYEVSEKKEDLWISLVGCISDAYVPEFYSEFKKNYPDLCIDSENSLDIYYNSEIGKIAQIFGAGLKDKTTNVISMLKFLMKVKIPYEVLEETNKNYSLHKRFNEINKKYEKLLNKAIRGFDESKDILFFEYSGDMSISSELANGLMQKFPGKIIVVGFKVGIKVNISIRGKKVREGVLKIIDKIDSATGGGHEEALGARVHIDDWENFKELFIREFSNLE